jgi:hypothetical protein
VKFVEKVFPPSHYFLSHFPLFPLQQLHGFQVIWFAWGKTFVIMKKLKVRKSECRSQEADDRRQEETARADARPTNGARGATRPTSRAAQRVGTDAPYPRAKQMAILGQLNISTASFDSLRGDSYGKHRAKRSLAGLKLPCATLLKPGEGYEKSPEIYPRRENSA